MTWRAISAGLYHRAHIKALGDLERNYECTLDKTDFAKLLKAGPPSSSPRQLNMSRVSPETNQHPEDASIGVLFSAQLDFSKK